MRRVASLLALCCLLLLSSTAVRATEPPRVGGTVVPSILSLGQPGRTAETTFRNDSTMPVVVTASTGWPSFRVSPWREQTLEPGESVTYRVKARKDWPSTESTLTLKLAPVQSTIEMVGTLTSANIPLQMDRPTAPHPLIQRLVSSLWEAVQTARLS